ncbi:MAG: DUF4290 domain-containing protein, partial [Bacteroidales bacterium]|nr:DUF4290 domain-containing protein [Bacteroidales bacterium]
TAMIHALAMFMRQQCILWNKDSAEETIFADIERLSEGRVKVPEGMQLTRVQNEGRQQNNRNNQQKQRKFNNRGRNRK